MKSLISIIKKYTLIIQEELYAKCGPLWLKPKFITNK